MTLHTLILIVQSCIAAGLAWSCFCRLAMTNGETQREIRLAIWFQAVTSGLVLLSPLLPALVPELCGAEWFQWSVGHTPTWIYVVSLLAATLMQLSTAHFWRFGVPRDFQTRGFLS